MNLDSRPSVRSEIARVHAAAVIRAASPTVSAFACCSEHPELRNTVCTGELLNVPLDTSFKSKRDESGTVPM